MGHVIKPVGGLAFHFDIICDWFLRWLETRSRIDLKLLELCGILCDGAWWQGLVEYVIGRLMWATVSPVVQEQRSKRKSVI